VSVLGLSKPIASNAIEKLTVRVHP